MSPDSQFMFERPQPPQSQHLAFDALPIHEKGRVLSMAINDITAALENPVPDDQRQQLATDYAALLLRREATFLQQKGLDEDTALGLTERTLMEGMRVVQASLPTGLAEQLRGIIATDATVRADLFATFQAYPLDNYLSPRQG
jgi:hypothetical protein